MAVHDWSSTWISGTVDTVTNMPELADNIDFTRVSHYHSLRDSLIRCEQNQYQKFIYLYSDPGSDISISTSYVQILPAAGSLSFTVSYPKEFIVKPMISFGAGSLSTFQFKFVFDEGGAAEQTVGDNESWRARGDNGGAYRSIPFAGTITLTSGSHNVKLYAKRVNGSSAGTVYGSSGALGSTGYMRPAMYLI